MTYKKMIFCTDCGTKLIEKELKYEGNIPFCPQCQNFHFPVFSTACSMIVMNEAKDKILLIRQYGIKEHILVAGYISQGEDAEQALIREVQEELNLTVTSLTFNQSKYYEASNSLMLNFTVTVTGQVTPNHEIDDWNWFSLENAKKAIKDGSLAEEFLLYYLEQ